LEHLLVDGEIPALDVQGLPPQAVMVRGIDDPAVSNGAKPMLSDLHVVRVDREPPLEGDPDRDRGAPTRVGDAVAIPPDAM